MGARVALVCVARVGAVWMFGLENARVGPNGVDSLSVVHMDDELRY